MKDMLEGLPTLAKVAAVVGVPSVIAMYLVLLIGGGVATAAQVTAVSAQLTAHADQTEKTQDTQVRLLRVICISLAKTDDARLECSR